MLLSRIISHFLAGLLQRAVTATNMQSIVKPCPPLKINNYHAAYSTRRVDIAGSYQPTRSTYYVSLSRPIAHLLCLVTSHPRDSQNLAWGEG